MTVTLLMPVEATAFETIDVPSFAEAFLQIVYLMIYLVVVAIVSGVRKYRQRKTGIFDSVSVLPLREQVIRMIELVLIVAPLLVWLSWYSETMFLSSYLLLCYFLEMTPQPQIPLLIRLIVAIIICVDFVRSASRIEHSHLKNTTPNELAIEPVRERIVTERVLVICPFCSTKVEQGVAFCPNCGGKM